MKEEEVFQDLVVTLVVKDSNGDFNYFKSFRRGIQEHESNEGDELEDRYKKIFKKTVKVLYEPKKEDQAFPIVTKIEIL